MNWLRYLLYGAAFAGGFLVTYWLTEPVRQPEPDLAMSFAGLQETGNRLAKISVPGHDELRMAAQNVGLKLTYDMKGFVEQVRRAGDVAEISGWVADLRGLGESSQLYVFAGGRFAGQTETRGERPDVTKVLNLESDRKANVRFIMQFQCRTGDPVRTIAVNPYGYYFVLNTERCP